MLIDISPPITERLKVFPGDTPPAREILLDTARGDHITLSTLRSTVHLGAHVDGECHYGRGGRGVDEWALERFVGPCRVVTAAAAASGARAGGGGRRVGVADLALPLEAIDQSRVLIRTGTHPDPERWTGDFAGIEPELIAGLAARGVRLLGVDTPSVDTADSKDLPAHLACLAGDVTILEGLVLEGVADGAYELIALPLRLAGFDGSPVRAVLRAGVKEQMGK